MAVSGSRDFILTRNKIITQALRKIEVLAQGENATNDQIVEAAESLNVMQLSWQNRGVFLWAQASDSVPLTDGTASYILSASSIGIDTPLYRVDDSDTPLTKLTREEYENVVDKKSEGTPTQVYPKFELASNTLWVWPVPDTTTAIVTGTDALKYVCIKDHTAATADKPITGANYATYWQTTTKTANYTWTSGTSYYSDIIVLTNYYRLQDFDAAGDNPDFSVRFYQALIYGLAAELSWDYGRKDLTQGLRASFEYEFKLALDADADSADLCIAPDLR